MSFEGPFQHRLFYDSMNLYSPETTNTTSCLSQELVLVYLVNHLLLSEVFSSFWSRSPRALLDFALLQKQLAPAVTCLSTSVFKGHFVLPSVTHVAMSILIFSFCTLPTMQSHSGTNCSEGTMYVVWHQRWLPHAVLSKVFSLTSTSGSSYWATWSSVLWPG